jgi:SAM-dependent methyltransferase
MAEIDQNRDVWQSWDWSQQGDEWSTWWGGTEAMWFGALLPRIHSFVPTGTILEIGPGYGRWTQYLKDLCERLVVVDLTESCIAHCQERFAECTHIDYHLNDGRSLKMIEDESIDFVFSFDSLVHVEADAIGAYLAQFATKLRPGGAGFLHHSNIRDYRLLTRLARRVPRRHLRPLVSRGLVIDLPAWRAESMSAGIFAAQCQRTGLSCVSQEKINWEHGPYLIDALSVIARGGSFNGQTPAVVRNRLFRREARRMARLYARAEGSDPGQTT